MPHKCYFLYETLCAIWYHLYVQLKKTLKTPMEGYLKVTLLHECFSSFINSKNGTKSRKAPYISSSDTLFAYLHSVKQI